MKTQRHGGRMPSDDEGRDWSYAATCQGMKKIANKPLKDRKRVEGFPYRFQREHGSANTLISDFQSIEL